MLAKTTLHDNSKKEKDEDDEYAFMAMVDQCPHKKVSSRQHIVAHDIIRTVM